MRGQRAVATATAGDRRTGEAVGGARREAAGERMGSPRGRGEGTAVAGVYLLTILPVYQSPAVDSLRGR